MQRTIRFIRYISLCLFWFIYFYLAFIKMIRLTQLFFFVVSWTLKGLKAEFRDKKIKISTELYRKGCVESVEEGLAAAQKIGFPVMIKASEGGGGKGIRKSESSEDFPNLYRQVRVFFQLINSCLHSTRSVIKFHPSNCLQLNQSNEFWYFNLIIR